MDDFGNQVGVAICQKHKLAKIKRKQDNAKASALKSRERGTHRRGRHSLLDTKQVNEILENYSVPFNRPSLTKLSKKFRVSIHVIRRIVKGSYTPNDQRTQNDPLK